MRQPIVPKCWQVEETGLGRHPSSCCMKWRVDVATWLCLGITSKAAWTLSRYSDQSSVKCQFLAQTATDCCSRARIHSRCLTIKTRVNSDKRISCLPLALKIWPIFHGQNPHSPSKWMLLTCVAPFQGAKNRLCNGIRYVAEKHRHDKGKYNKPRFSSWFWNDFFLFPNFSQSVWRKWDGILPRQLFNWFPSVKQSKC